MHLVVAYKVKINKKYFNFFFNFFFFNCQLQNKAAYKRWSFPRISNCEVSTGTGFHLIYARHLEVIYQTREGVFHLLTKNPKSINPKSEKQYIKHEKSVSSDIFKTPRSIISNKRRSVSSDN